MIKDPRLAWRKSSHSGADNGNCVEVAYTLDALRDSKNTDGPVLSVPVRALITAIRDGHIG